MSGISYSSRLDSEIMADVGKRLRALRRDRGMTQSEVADRAGLSRHTLYRAEQGDNPTLMTLVRLLRAYGRLAALDGFIPPTEISPMARLRKRRAQAARDEPEARGEPEAGDG